MRATCRMTGAAKNTVTKLLAEIGQVCSDFQDRVLRDLPCRRLEADEIWAFCYAKEKNVPPEKRGQFGYGDVWTFTSICADTKIVPAWWFGYRNADTAFAFMSDLASRLAHRAQITTDGHTMYLDAVPAAFMADVDFAMLHKVYGSDPEAEKRYSPARCLGVRKRFVTGHPDRALVSTSYVERQNLTMRMSMRRFTRLTNGFSKKVENLTHAVALHFMYYNFCRVHRTLRVTPAMEAGVANRIYEIEDIVRLLERHEAAA